jgi:ABC-2 type transport system ATP-binding protein
MKQKLAIARALLHRPPLIFLDEPTAGLDPVASAALRDDLARLVRREGVTVFLTTHNLAEAERLCSQVAVIQSGRILATGSPHDLRRGKDSKRLEISGSGFTPDVVAALRGRPEVHSVSARDGGLLLQVAPGAPAAPLVSLLVAGGASVEGVREDTESLEEAFLALLGGKEEAERRVIYRPKTGRNCPITTPPAWQ